MAGHSHWKQIKIKKALSDQKKGKMFSKLLNAITIAAKIDPNPDFNPRLRNAILKAKEFQVPQENINKAVQRSKEKNSNLEEALLECYGPGGVAMLVEVVTDKTTRTVNEIKNILKDYDTKLGEPGSAKWAFDFEKEKGEWIPKFLQEISPQEKEKLINLLDELDEHEDVQDIFVNANI